MDRLIQANAQYQIILQEYWMLFQKRHLTEQEADRLEEIFDQAAEDASLALLIDELDHVLGHELKMIDVHAVERSRNELKGMLDKQHIDLTIENFCSITLRDAQKRLEKEGYYNGSIDGVYGPKTRKAFQKLRERIGKAISQQGMSTEIQQLLEMENQFRSFC